MYNQYSLLLQVCFTPNLSFYFKLFFTPNFFYFQLYFSLQLFFSLLTFFLYFHDFASNFLTSRCNTVTSGSNQSVGKKGLIENGMRTVSRLDSSPNDTSPRTIPRLTLSRRTFRRTDNSPIGHFPTGHFPTRTFPRPDISLTVHFPDHMFYWDFFFKAIFCSGVFVITFLLTYWITTREHY